MKKRLIPSEHGAMLLIDRPLLDMLAISSDAAIDISTDGRNLIITPGEIEGETVVSFMEIIELPGKKIPGKTGH
jgi:hypothetical protein